MIVLPEQWLADVQKELAKALTEADARSEPLIAAHVATALECVRIRLQQS